MKNALINGRLQSTAEGRHVQKRAFTLVEVLLAVFILSMGLIMLLAIFPVGADWTRQVTEETIGQTIAQNAMSVIRMRYGPGGSLNGMLVTTNFNGQTLVPLPGVAQIPLGERAYAFGSSPPFPAAKPQSALYYWTAVARIPPGQSTQSMTSYDVYIMVMKKGQISDTYSTSGELAATGAGGQCRVAASETFVPMVSNSGAGPQVGELGIGQTSGTVFRVGLTSAGTVRSPAPMSIESIIYVPPVASGASPSPLVYVYQTTLSF